MCRFVAIIYFDGHASRWRRSLANWTYEEHAGGLRIPLPRDDGSMMPEPQPDEIVQRREFRWRWAACAWALSRVKGFDGLLAEVRPA